MNVNTAGWKSSEFILLVVGAVLIVFLVVAENALKWNVQQAFDLSIYLFGGNATYALGRSYYKGKKIEALASLGGNGSGEKILERLGAFVKESLPDPKKKK